MGLVRRVNNIKYEKGGYKLDFSQGWFLTVLLFWNAEDRSVSKRVFGFQNPEIPPLEKCLATPLPEGS